MRDAKRLCIWEHEKRRSGLGCRQWPRRCRYGCCFGRRHLRWQLSSRLLPSLKRARHQFPCNKIAKTDQRGVSNVVHSTGVAHRSCQGLLATHLDSPSIPKREKEKKRKKKKFEETIIAWAALAQGCDRHPGSATQPPHSHPHKASLSGRSVPLTSCC